MRNTIILTILLFIAVIGASIYYFTGLNGEKKETLRPLTFLPEDTFLISTFHNDATTDNIFNDFEIFEALIGKSEMKQWQILKSKLLRNTVLQPYVEGIDIYISLHPEKEHISTLFTIPTHEKMDPEHLAAIMQEANQHFNVTQKDTLGTRIFHLANSRKDSVVHIAYHKEVLFASYSDSLLYKVMDNKAPKLAAAQIDYFVDNNSRNSPLSVYFVHDQVPNIANHLMRNASGNFLRLFEHLGGQSAWNLNFKNDALILSGESETQHRKENYLEVFGQQSKTTQRLFNYFPENTASYLAFAVSNTSRFQQDLEAMFEKRGEWEKIQQQFGELKRSKDLSLVEDIRPIFGNEFAIVEQSNQTQLGFIALSDSSNLSKRIHALASAAGDSIFRFDQANIPYALFGDPFKTFTRPFFIRIANIVVLANNQSVLQTFRQDWRRENLLVNTLGFKNFEKIQGNEANVTFFQRTRTASPIINYVLKPAYGSIFRDKENFGFQDFFSWSTQISGNNGDFLSSIYAIYKSKNALGATADWTYEFDNRPITAPWVFEHSDTSQFILIQEQDHTVHGIHPSGKKLWSAVFQGRIVGDAQQLADRSIVLVTDRNRLYRFDSNGKGLPGFSIALDAEPSYQPTIAELDGQQVVLIPAGRKVMAYSLDGKEINRWKENTLDGKILFDIKVRDNRVYVGTDNGHFYQFNAQGEMVKKDVVEASQFRSPIALTAVPDNKIIVMAIDTAGNFVRMDFEHAPEKKQVGSWAGKSIISFDSNNQQNASAVVVIDEKKLQVFGLPDGSARYDFTFTQQVGDRPQYFNNGSLLGIASRENSLIYLFDEQGAVHTGFPIEALPQFYYGKIDYNSGNYLLCVRRDKKLYAFKN